jgi:fido (protein-threonine AMPylation protein)
MILVKPFWKDAIDYNGKPTRKLIKIGEYKETPNSVRLRNGEIHEYASPEETPVRMAELVSWYQKNNSTMHPVQLAAEFHYRFVCIHPFDDGNGRVARLVMNYILFKNDYPIVVIKSDDKENYLTALQKADTGNVLAIIEYIEKQAIWSLELSIKAAKGEDIEEYGDIDKEIELLKRDKLTKATIYKTPKVVDEIFHHVYDTIWIPLTRVLEKFNDFFAETQVPSYEAPVPIGSEISWSMYLLSLKSASKKRNVSIKCNLRFDDSTYTITIFEANGVRNHQILTIENDYKTLFMQADVDNIIRSVSNHLLETIKSAE